MTSGSGQSPNPEALAVPLTRRSLLKASLGGAALLAASDFVPPGPAMAAGALGATGTTGPPSAATSLGYFFLYGILDPTSPPAVQSVQPQGGATFTTISSQLAALPVVSPDGNKLGLVSLEGADTTPLVVVTVLDKLTNTVVSTGSLALTGLPGAMILITPVFAGDSSTLCLVLSVTVPTNQRTATKLDPNTGETISVPAATWVSNHMLAYFSSGTGAFAGPFDLSDAPSLARVNLVASATDLFVWTIAEPAAVIAAGGAVPQPQLLAFPLGSGNPRFTVDASPVWPVNSEPTGEMPDGQLVRLVYGRELEVYSPIDGSLTSVSLGPLDTPSAKPAYATMQLQNDNLLFIAKPVTGQAVVLDPNSSFEVLAQLTFPVPPNAGGGPTSKAVLSADGATLYTLGQGLSGGIDAYAVPSGTPVASQADGNQYNGIYILPSGTIMAIQQVNPRLSFFDSSLNSIATADTNLSVVGVF